MLQKVFVFTAAADRGDAELAKFAVERRLPPGSSIRVEVIESEDPELEHFSAPERMAFAGRALAIGPNIFTVHDITPLMTVDLGECRLAACKTRDGWDSSLMLLDCERLKDWRMKDFKQALNDKMVERREILKLKIEPDVFELSRIWNSPGILNQETKILNYLPPKAVSTQAPKSWLQKLNTLFGRTPLAHPDKRIEAFMNDLKIQSGKH